MKKTSIKYSLLFLVFIAITTSCAKGGSDESKEPPKEPVGKPVAILPVNAETCSDFIEVQSDESKATILFSWSAAANASNYLVEVLESGMVTSSVTTNTTSTELTLDKGTSYSWRITARNASSETQSDTFSFITPGEATGNFAPYAAEISMNFNATNGELVISWIGKDEDGDLLTYDVVVKEDDVIIEEQENLTTAELNPIYASAGAIYSVQVKSKDSFGNFSVSTNTLKIED